MIGLLLVCGQTVWRNYVRDVAVPCGFARPWWEVLLRICVFSLISLARSSLFSYLLTSCCVLFNTFISKIQATSAHLLYATFFLSSHLLTDLTSYLLSLLLSSHLFWYLLHHFYILNHQKLTFMFYIYKLNVHIFSFSRSRATRRLVFSLFSGGARDAHWTGTNEDASVASVKSIRDAGLTYLLGRKPT